LWDLVSGVQITHQIIFEKDQVTASTLAKGKMILGHSSGKVQVINLGLRRVEFIERLHDAQVTAIKMTDTGHLFTADVHGGVKVDGKECFRCDVAIITLIGCSPIIVVAADGRVFHLSTLGKVARTFSLGVENVNCAVVDEREEEHILVAGTDTGHLIYYDMDTGMRMLVTVKEDIPITSMFLTNTHLIAGTFTGHIVAYSWPGLRPLFQDTNHRAPIWSLAADEENLISSALDSSPILRRRFLFV